MRDYKKFTNTDSYKVAAGEILFHDYRCDSLDPDGIRLQVKRIVSDGENIAWARICHKNIETFVKPPAFEKVN